jgi:outer membrane protein assembly factor BamC
MREPVIRTSLRATGARLLPAIALAVIAGGCSLFDSKIDYKSVKRTKPLEVPPELTQPAADDRFAVPGGGTTFTEYERSRTGAQRQQAAGAVLQPDTPKSRIERAGTQRWLVVQATPEQAWQQLLGFWQSLGVPLEKELPALGIMETEWVEERARFSAGFMRDLLSRALDIFYASPERNKFRVRVEQGADAGTTEIYFSHRQMHEVYITEGRTETRWHPQPANPDVEAEMLRRFALFTGIEDSVAREMIVAPRPPSAERSRLVERQDRVVLELDERFDRAWRRVGLALDRTGFTVEDRDRAAGVFFVRYVDSDAAALRDSEENFFSKLAFWRKRSEAVVQTEFSVVVKGEGERSYVRVGPRQPEGPEDLPTARKILGLLNEQLR